MPAVLDTLSDSHYFRQTMSEAAAETSPTAAPEALPPAKIESMEDAFRVLRRGPETEGRERVENALIFVFKTIDRLVAQRDVAPHYLQLLMLEQRAAAAKSEAERANRALLDQGARISQLEEAIDQVGMEVAKRVNALHSTESDLGDFKLRGVVDVVVKEKTAVADEDEAA